MRFSNRLKNLFGTPGKDYVPPPPPPPPPPPNPTVESVFGDDPYLDNPTYHGPNGTYGLNPVYFATIATANKLVSLYGGKVVAVMGGGGTFFHDQKTLLIEYPNGNRVNAGFMASQFGHGQRTQTQIDAIIHEMIATLPEA